MYVLMNKTGTAVFQGYTPTGRIRWAQLDELKKEPNGFQLTIFKDPSLQIEVMKCQDCPVVVVAEPLEKLLAFIGGEQ